MKSDQNLATALVSILRKIEIMTENVIVSNEQNYLVLSSVDAVMKSSQTELKKQTSLLTSIKNVITGKSKGVFNKDKSESSSKSGPNTDNKNITELAPAFLSLVKAAQMLDNTSADKITVFLTSLSKSLVEFSKIEMTDSDGISSVLDGIGSMADKIAIFGENLAEFTSYSTVAKKGAEVFRETLNILMKGLTGADETQVDALKSIGTVAEHVGTFGKNLAIFMLYAPVAKKGAATFRETINILIRGLGGVNDKQTAALSAIASIAEHIGTFGKNLAIFMLYAPIANKGAALFRKTVNILLRGLTDITEDKAKGVSTIVSIGKGILLFGGSLALVALLAVPILLGSVAVSFAVKILLNTFIGMNNKKIKDGAHNIIKGSIAIVTLGLSLFLFNSIVNPVQSILSLLVIAGIGLAFGFIGTMSLLIKKGAFALLYVAAPIVLLTGAMYIWSMANAKIEDVGVLLALVGGLGIVFGLAGVLSGLLKKGANALYHVAIPILILTGAMYVWSMANAKIEDVGVLLALVGGLSIVFGLAGILSSFIKRGALAMIIAAIPILILTGAMYIWSMSKVEIADVGVLLALVGGLGIVMGLTGLAFPIVALGAVAMGLSSLAILLMSVALEKFQTLNWTPANTTNLSDTIKAVLGALSGTSEDKSLSQNIKGAVGQGFQAIASLFSIGPLLLGSAAIWLMSEALLKFKSIQWTTKDTTDLGGTIDVILGSLSQNVKTAPIQIGNSMLANISALMGAGSIFVASGAIWLMSEALLKFKEVQWSPALTASLNSTITTVLGVFAGSEKGGGLWSKLKSTAKSWLGASASVGNATSIGLAALSIGSLADGLQKWKSLGWADSDTKALTSAISSILLTTATKGNDNLFMLANNFNRIQNSMKLFKDHVNAMDIKKLTLTDSMMHSIAVLSKSPDAIGKTIQETIEKSFEKMTNAFISSIKGVKEETSNRVSNTTVEHVAGAQPQIKSNSQVQTKSNQQLFTLDDMQEAFTAALMTVTLKVKHVDSAFS